MNIYWTKGRLPDQGRAHIQIVRFINAYTRGSDKTTRGSALKFLIWKSVYHSGLDDFGRHTSCLILYCARRRPIYLKDFMVAFAETLLGDAEDIYEHLEHRFTYYRRLGKVNIP